MAVSRDDKISFRLWERAKEIFEAAVDLESHDRESYLENACVDDSALLAEVRDLLDFHDRASSFLQDPAKTQAAVPSILPVFSTGQIVAHRFRIMRFIGSGGMGEVYLAYDLELGELVALKTLRAILSADARMVTSFRQEVHLARQVTHPNVCRIFDMFWHHDGDQSAIAILTMEYLPGQTLLDIVHSEGPLSSSEALPIIRQVAEGLDAAHKFGIIHGDFKSGNVMLVPQVDGTTRAVITDFGLASEQHQTSAEPHGMAGTPAYIAPEQLQNMPLTPAVDLYAFGVVMFEMLTGQLPFRGGPETLLSLKRQHFEPPSPRQYASELNRYWEAAILKCLSQDPSARPLSALDVYDRGRGGRSRSRRWFLVSLLGAASLTPLFRMFRSRQQPKAVSASFKRAQEFAKRRTREGLENAVQEYKQAINADPNNTEAWAGLADAYSAMANFQFMDAGEALAAARKAAERAVQLDPTSGHARGVLAYCMSINLQQWLHAEPDFEQAIHLAPTDAEVRLWYGAHLTRLGRYKEASVQLRSGLNEDPMSLTLNEQLATVYFLEGRRLEFEQLARELVRLHPLEATAYLVLARALEDLGRYKEALENCREADKYRHSEGALCLRGSIEASRGQRSTAVAIAEQVEKYWNQNPFESLLLSALYAKLGENPKAVEVLLAGCERNDSSVLLAPKHPYLASIHSEPKYAEFLKRIGLQR